MNSVIYELDFVNCMCIFCLSIGMKGSNFRVLDEKLAYSLSKERTTTKLFILEYEQTMKGNLVEMCLEELISRFDFTY